MTPERKTEIGQAAAKILLDTKSILFNTDEPFRLTSGRLSPVYIDCRRLVSFVAEREALSQMAAELLSDAIGADKIDYIAGGETAGIPYAAFISTEMKKPMLYVRKKPKGFGRMAQIEGTFDNAPSPKPHVVLVEDLQTDGGSKRVFVDALREAGAEVKHGFVVFHYGIFEQSLKNMESMGLTLHELTNWWHVIDVARESNYFPENVIAEVEKFLKAPEIWQEVNSPKTGSSGWVI
ncbi:MAG: orotate phosphoribosyltransferase [Alphaproteobacteria bacterium]|nr:orotate phosphoribosyltransferase [Alphaproteobacteria bacterium]MCD8525889.1 orotate phosphoribosyltransferase [Alphaproteobacteria bacterium]MCD8570028.1 orotate phosphoribosyltransferase [Alphaproteobacteria bacterium]